MNERDTLIKEIEAVKEDKDTYSQLLSTAQEQNKQYCQDIEKNKGLINTLEVQIKGIEQKIHELEV